MPSVATITWDVLIRDSHGCASSNAGQVTTEATSKSAGEALAPQGAQPGRGHLLPCSTALAASHTVCIWCTPLLGAGKEQFRAWAVTGHTPAAWRMAPRGGRGDICPAALPSRRCQRQQQGKHCPSAAAGCSTARGASSAQAAVPIPSAQGAEGAAWVVPCSILQPIKLCPLPGSSPSARTAQERTSHPSRFPRHEELILPAASAGNLPFPPAQPCPGCPWAVALPSCSPAAEAPGEPRCWPEAAGAVGAAPAPLGRAGTEPGCCGRWRWEREFGGKGRAEPEPLEPPEPAALKPAGLKHGWGRAEQLQGARGERAAAPVRER